MMSQHSSPTLSPVPIAFIHNVNPEVQLASYTAAFSDLVVYCAQSLLTGDGGLKADYEAVGVRFFHTYAGEPRGCLS
jgi:hypothetical protein